MDWPLAIAIVALAATAAFIQALSGFGFSLFIVPFLAILIGPKDTVLLANLLSTFSGAIQARTLRHAAERRTAGILMLGSCIGMPFGLAILFLVDPAILNLLIAAMVIIFTLLLMRGLALHTAGTLGDLIAGVTSGVLNTSTSMSGPPIVLYLQGRGMAPLQFRATIATFFFVTSAIAVALLLASGGAKAFVFVALALSLPAVVLGQRLGNRMFERVNAVYFRRMVYGILLLSGAVAIVGTIV
ncbi:MAG: sulfite exporter TauE/SafE family protein [bacterium]